MHITTHLPPLKEDITFNLTQTTYVKSTTNLTLHWSNAHSCIYAHNTTFYNFLTHLNPFTVSSVQQLSISLLGGWTLRFGLQGVVTLGTSGSVASFSEVWSSRSLVVSPTCAVLSGCSSHCWLDTCGLRSTRFLLRDAPCSVWIW